MTSIQPSANAGLYEHTLRHVRSRWGLQSRAGAVEEGGRTTAGALVEYDAVRSVLVVSPQAARALARLQGVVDTETTRCADHALHDLLFACIASGVPADDRSAGSVALMRDGVVELATRMCAAEYLESVMPAPVLAAVDALPIRAGRHGAANLAMWTLAAFADGRGAGLDDEVRRWLRDGASGAALDAAVDRLLGAGAAAGRVSRTTLHTAVLDGFDLLEHEQTRRGGDDAVAGNRRGHENARSIAMIALRLAEQGRDRGVA